MLHDSGLYGPNEAPGTMGAPVKKTGVGGTMDIAPILSNKGSLHHNRPSPSLPQYTPQHYAPMVPNTVPIESQINPFLSYTNARVHSNIHHHIPAIYSQNGLSPFDFNAMTNHNSEFNHSIHEKVFYGHMTSSTKNSSWCPKESSNATPQSQNQPPNQVQTLPKDAINHSAEMPILYNKKHTENPKDNYDLQTVSGKRKNLIDLRTERIENTFRRIESIIATDISSRKRALESSSIEKEKEQTSPKLYEKSSSSEQSESEDDDSTLAGPQKLEVKIETNVDNTESDNETEVEVKLEKMSWTDSDFRNPFIHDQNGVTKDNIDSLSEEIVGADMSVEEAKHSVKYGLSDDTRHYECPQCSLHFAHPKRFLVHHSWHTFGLTNLTRQIQALAKEARAAVRSGELPAAAAEAAGAGGVFPCRECDKVFQKKSTLKRHKTKSHKKPVTECRICNASVSDWRALREHHALAHKEQDGFKCDKCEKVFKLKHNLTKHAQSHFEKIHPCPHCPKLFATETIARKHQRCHSEPKGRREAKHHCSYCGKSFTENFNLQAHERSHRNERPYQCTLCSSAYATNSSLKRHVRVSHNAAKPFTCETCHKSFSTQNILNRHCVREHTDESLLTHGCALCPNKYRSAKDLRQHVYKVHARRNKGAASVPVEVLLGQQDD